MAYEIANKVLGNHYRSNKLLKELNFLFHRKIKTGTITVSNAVEPFSFP